MKISMNTVIAFDKIQHAFMTKRNTSVRNRRELLRPDKGHLLKTHN